MKHRDIIAVVLAAAVLLSGCDFRSKRQNGAGSSGGINLSPIIIKAQKENPTQTGSYDGSTKIPEMSDLPETAEQPLQSVPESTNSETKEEASEQAIQWEEWEYIEDLYTNALVSSKAKPLDTAGNVRVYEKNTPVSVVALTSTRYFKLDSGDYIPTDKIYLGVITNSETIKTELTYDPPENTVGNTVYDPKKALDYAREHWQDEESFCAGFGSECLTAGGLDYNETSSTKLFNMLMAADLGYAVTIDLNKDGTINVPDYVYPGDIIFYYCAEENMMVHTAVYNGNTKDGFAKAYAHNLADDGEKAFKYYSFCREGCGALLEKVVVFCFYRDGSSVTLPSDTPKLSGKISKDLAELTWDTDFVYRSSELVVTDKRGKIVCRREMGTDKSDIVELEQSGGYVAYVVFNVYDNIRVRSENFVFTI